jgi:hypothetical protein
MNISKAKTEMSLNTGELQALKMRTINERVKPLALSDLDNVGLKAKAEELWKTIVVLETSKYDLAERATRQEYDVSCTSGGSVTMIKYGKAKSQHFNICTLILILCIVEGVERASASNERQEARCPRFRC